MKLNIEELAREAGALPERDETFGKVYEMEVANLEAFARLIVERCAVECMKQQSDLRTRQRYAAAIRELLEAE